MTTAAAERLYAAQHVAQWGERGYACYNPNYAPVETLPVIYGFNNGGSAGWYSACLLAEDGTGLGGHLCSHECYMPHDLGIIEGSRADRHEGFKAHYPSGYRMDFVSHGDVPAHGPLNKAFALSEILAQAIEAAAADKTAQTGLAEGESAVATPCAQGDPA